MFNELQPYKTYAKLVDWLPATPSHWNRARFRNILQESDDRASDGSEQLLRVSQYTGVTERRGPDGGSDSRAATLVGYKRVRPDQLAVNIMLAWNGSLGVSLFQGIVSPAYCVYKFPGAALPWYYHHLLRSPEYKARIKSLSRGVVESRLRLYTADLFGMEALQPPLNEQTAIVKYLRHAHARIDRAIAAKRRLIALLEEQKQAVIHQAVTRGLEPSVALKDSGIPWLNGIPAHWETIRLKWLISAGPTNGISPQVTENGDLETFSLSAIREGILDVQFSDRKHVPRSAVARISDYLLDEGDVVLVRGNGNLRIVGRAAEVTAARPDAIYPDLIIRIRPIPTVNPSYLVMAINSPAARSQIEIAARTAVGTFKVNGETVKNLKLVVPDLQEQLAIVEHCNVRTRTIRSSIQTALREIDLLREFRTRLTSDVVTGQIDVREIAATLPTLTDDALVAGADMSDEDDEVETVVLEDA